MIVVEIVTHCWCPPGLPWYAEHLRWQYASLWRYADGVPVVWTVCWCGDDTATAATLERCRRHQRLGLTIREIALEPERLFRRAIGRNIAATTSDADVVWFTDCDYLFGRHCVQDVTVCCSPKTWLAMPKQIAISTTHELGQQLVEAAVTQDLPTFDPGDFARRDQKIAIGGVQIVGGDVARDNGYLRGDAKWQKPVDAFRGFRSCRCDVAFRQAMGGRAERVPIRSVFRLRHTADGRDYTREGEKLGRQVW